MKKTLFAEKIVIYAVVIIALLFAGQIIFDCINYNAASDSIKNGDYIHALETLEKLGGFRDSEKLKEYCTVMKDYDPKSFVSVYHCYRELSDISPRLDNKKLEETFIRTTTEVETLYNHYSISLSAK